MARNKKNIFVFLFIFLFLFLGKTNFALSCSVGCTTTDCSSRADCQDCSFCGGHPGVKDLGTFRGLGALSNFITSLNPTNPAPAATAFSNFISTAIGVMTVVAFIWFILVLFIGAVAWLSSGGDKVKLQEAQKKITTAVTGLIIVISAIFLIKIVGVVFGFDILDITGFITNL